MLVGGQGHSHR